jgi:triphosphoribosyl-dephospho-CoA synthase
MATREHPIAKEALLACLWEVTARKPGNVHRFRDFHDTTYLDFVVSAIAIAPHLAQVDECGVGLTIARCVNSVRSLVGKNTNLGIILLLAVLARGRGYRDDVEDVLVALTVEDAAWAYDGIRQASPGGLGDAPAQDVRTAPSVTLRQAMALAADRDLIARQYANGFREVFDVVAPAVLTGIEKTGCVEGGILFAQLDLMSRIPDSLIARKCGPEVAGDSASRAARVLELGWPHTSEGRREIASLDEWLRADGNRRNPGTTADMITASLFVTLFNLQLVPNKHPWPLAEGAP